MAKHLPDLKPCPYCGRQPSVEICEPWSKTDGPQPWYAGCYQPGAREHFVGDNGVTRGEAMENWNREAEKHAASPIR